MTVSLYTRRLRPTRAFGIQAGLGVTATVNAALKLATLKETVTVSGQSSVADARATTLTSSYSADAIRSLPTTGEYWALFSVTPVMQISSEDVEEVSRCRLSAVRHEGPAPADGRGDRVDMGFGWLGQVPNANHLFEFEFRWNTRTLNDGQRVARAIKSGEAP